MATVSYDIKLNAQQALDQLKKFSDNLQRVGNDFRGAFEGAETLAKRLQLAIVAAGAATAHFADQISDVADANNAAVSDVLGLAKALSLTGGNAESAGRVFQQLNNSILEANQGNDKTVKTFEKLGVSVQDLATLSDTEIRNRVLTALADMADSSERNALAFQIFGKSLMGVNIKEFAQQQQELGKRYRDNEAAIKTAGQAFDNLSGILSDLKVAFAEAFQPVFAVLARLKISVEDLTIVWKLLAAAMVAATGAAVIGGLIKVIGLLKTMNDVIGKNKIIAIASALIAVSTAAATYLGLTKDTADAQSDLNNEIESGNDKTEKTKRDQTELLEKRKKELESLRSVNEALAQSFRAQRDKLDIQLRGLGLSEEQRRIEEEIAQIQQQANEKLISLRQKFEAQSADAQARTRAAYEEEQKLIQQNADIQKRAVEATMKALEAQRLRIQDTTNSFKILSDTIAEIVRIQAGLDSKTGGERIQTENNLNAILKERSILIEQINKLSVDEQFKAIRVLDETVLSMKDLGRSTKDVTFEFVDLLMANLRAAGASQETINKLISGLSAQRGAISQSFDLLNEKQQELYQNSRTFEYGWNRAFREFVDNATNAALQAENIFRRAMSGMEDAIVNFAKTGKFQWKNFVQMMAEELLRSQIRQLMANIMTGFGGGGARGGNRGGGGGGGLFGGLLGGIGKIFGFAGGGVVGGNQPILVGERGPEVFMPPGGGRIIPNDALGGGTQVTYNINAVDAASFQALLAANPQYLYAVTEMGRRSMPGAR